MELVGVVVLIVAVWALLAARAARRRSKGGDMFGQPNPWWTLGLVGLFMISSDDQGADASGGSTNVDGWDGNSWDASDGGGWGGGDGGGDGGGGGGD